MTQDYKERFLQSLLDTESGKDKSISSKLVDEKLNRAKRNLLYKNNPGFSGAKANKASTVRDAIVSAAAEEIGVNGGINGANKYNSFKAQPWCGDYANFVMSKAGVSLPSQTSVYSGMEEMKKLGRYRDRNSGYVPLKGDFVYFNWEDGGSIYDHVGIVESFDGENLYTIEGNTNGGKVARRIRSLNSVMGYGVTD